MIAILIGPPGAGKGTQAERLRERLQMAHVASGDLFRDNLKNGTELGRLAKSYMDKGELVPDDVVINMILERLAEPDCGRGVVLDGFPRTVAQADALGRSLSEEGRQVNAALYIKADEQVLLNRLSGRWICRNCQVSYHEKFNPPSVHGVCDACGGELYQRDDDRRDVAEHRLQVYFQQTMPVIQYYRDQGLLAEVPGDQDIDSVTANLVDAIQKGQAQVATAS